MSGSLLSARGLGKDHGHGATLVRAVKDVDLDIGTGEAVAIVGPSGCGKSSLLYLLGGLERPTTGTISFAGDQMDGLSEAELARIRRGAIGFVFQAFELIDELTAVENVELPALLARNSPRAAQLTHPRRSPEVPGPLRPGQCHGFGRRG
jgi:putative ABC transport system ATP-binding protein